MPVSAVFPVGALEGFLLVLCRVGGALVFVPLPGARGALEPARAALAIGSTVALAARWPVLDPPDVSAGALLGRVAAEAGLGIAVGVAVAIALEALMLAAQILGLQAGFAYASTVDPTSEADSGVLLVVAQLLGGMMFFALGLHREVLRLFAETLDRIPPGKWEFGPASAAAILRLGSNLFAAGVRLALPVVALLLMVDLALALLGRLNQQLQLLSLAFPLKMLAALIIVSWLSVIFPRILLSVSGESWAAARRALGL